MFKFYTISKDNSGKLPWKNILSKIKSKRAKQLTTQSFTIAIATSSAVNSPDVSDINRVSKGCQQIIG